MQIKYITERTVSEGSQVLMHGVCRLLLLGGTLLVLATAASAQQIELMWLGHSTFRITSTTGKVIVIDPAIRNTNAPIKYRELSALGKVDLILVTHGHGDHIADLPELARITGAPVVAQHELALNLNSLGVVDASKTIAMNKGGTVSPLGPGIKVHMVQAQHSSGVDLNMIKPDFMKGVRFLDGGNAVGYVLELENGFRIYHTGDTDVFSDMALIQRFHKPDLALVCIGGHFTMDPERAAYAMRELVRPKQVIPMHYGTYPVLNRTPAEFKAALGNAPIKMLEIKPGETLKF
jgi:L-ascorbate metabolism protein UlaG (beta-lactamase superfamily)